MRHPILFVKHPFLTAAALAVLMVGCAPTPAEIQGASVWANFGEKELPPIPAPPMKATVETDSVGGRPGPVAIWGNTELPSESLVIGTVAESSGGVVVFDILGGAKQRFMGMGYPADIEVEYAMRFGNTKFKDIVVVLDQSARMLHVYAVDQAAGEIYNITGKTAILESTQGDASIPTGMALYRHPSGTVYAYVTRKLNDGDGAIWQYELIPNNGNVNTKYVRSFGIGSKRKPVSAIVADDGTDYLYYYDDEYGILQYHAEPRPESGKDPLTKFAFSGWKGRPAGLGIFTEDAPGGGYIVGLDANDGTSDIVRYKREDIGGDPFRHEADPMDIKIMADSPRGFDVTSLGIGKRFGEGFFVVGNAANENYGIYAWADIAKNRVNHEASLRRERIEDLTRSSTQ